MDIEVTNQASALDAPFKALVIGASGAIGNAFMHALQKDVNCEHVEILSRSANPGFDLLNESSLQRYAQACSSSGPFQLIIDATGALTINGVSPEKSLTALRNESLAENFQINAIGPILTLKYFSSLLAPGNSIYAKLSARVGSISDNQKGGWYGYRASKAALNMLLQTAAIELQRKNPHTSVVALQPGTVRSKLSEPFTKAVPHLLEPEQSVAGMLKTLRNVKTKHGAQFLDYKGESITW